MDLVVRHNLMLVDDCVKVESDESEYTIHCPANKRRVDDEYELFCPEGCVKSVSTDKLKFLDALHCCVVCLSKGGDSPEFRYRVPDGICSEGCLKMKDRGIKPKDIFKEVENLERAAREHK